MWVLKLVSCFRVTRAEACKLCVRLHIVVAVADAAVVAVAVAWHECLMRDGSNRQLLPAIGTNAGHTGQTKTRTKSETKQTNKKRKNTICVVWMWILFVRFFSHKFTFVIFCSVIGICTLVQGLDTYAPSLPTLRVPFALLPPLYTFNSQCLFMSFCLCCLHSVNCAIFKRLVLVFSQSLDEAHVCVCDGGGCVSSVVVVPTPNRRCSSTKFVSRLTKLNSTLTTQRRPQYVTSVSTQRSSMPAGNSLRFCIKLKYKISDKFAFLGS